MLDTLARMLGLSRTEAEESLHSERAARHVLTRRDALGLAGAMCAGVVLGDVPVALGRYPGPLEQSILRAIEQQRRQSFKPFVWYVHPRDYEKLRELYPAAPPVSQQIFPDVYHPANAVTVVSTPLVSPGQLWVPPEEADG